MARTLNTNYSGGTVNYTKATAGTDAFAKEDLQKLAEAHDTHDHSNGLGLGVLRIQTGSAPAAAGQVQVTGNLLKWYTSSVVTAVDDANAQTALGGAKTWTALATFNAGVSVPTGFNVTGAGTAQVTGFATISGTTLTGTLSTAAQANVTSLGTLTSITTSGTITLTSAASQIIPGATSLSLRNNANNANNLIITDAGAATIRAGLTVTSGGLTVSAGNVGVGDASGVNVGLAVGGSGFLSTATQYGITSQPTFSSGATTAGRAIYANVITAAASYTMTNADGIYVDTPVKGASSTITTARGIYVNAQTQGGTNNYGVYIEAPSGGATTNIGLYNAGTSSLVGNVTTSGTITQTSASATAFVSGPNGATNPVFTLVNNTGSQAAGLRVTGATAAGTVAVDVTSSGAAANATFDAKGSGTIGIGTVSTGAITLGRATTITTGGLTVSAGGAAITGASLPLTVTTATVDTGAQFRYSGATSGGSSRIILSANNATSYASSVVIAGVSNAGSVANDLIFYTGSTATDGSGGTQRLAISQGGIVSIGSPGSTSGAAAGDLLMANSKSIRATNAAGNSAVQMFYFDGSDRIQIGPSSTIFVSGTANSLGFYGTAPITKPAPSGSRGGNAALASLLTALANLGLLTDSTSA